MNAPRRQSSSRDASHDGNDKTYVWVRLRDGNFSPDAGAHHTRAGSAVANKKRGAPIGNGSSDDMWGWAPGYYCVADADGGAASEGKEGGAARYRFTLLGLDGSDEGHGEDFQRSEHTLTEDSTTKLLESGDIVLANAWEGRDFVNRLELGNGGDDDESYNYDDDSESDDEDDPATSQINHLLDDTPEEAPPSNLIDLTHLHEPSVVHALRHRYGNTSEDMCNIYTDTGPILLAVNPFKHDESGQLYGDDTVMKYRVVGESQSAKERGKGAAGGNDEVDEGESLPPHVYAVADKTFRTMMSRLHPAPDVAPQSSMAANKAKSSLPPQSPLLQDNSAPKVNQSVLVSGESGAGKTVTTKLLMAYLSKLSEGEAECSQSGSTDDEEGMSIERRVLESNPILESFGNARTVRNDNSSRFGKYIEMKFSSSGGYATSIPGATLTGASIETYLLEKVRLVHQAPGERNYHVFYELFSMKYEESDDAEVNETFLDKVGLADYDMEDFNLINSSDTYDRRDGVSDSSTFHDMKLAMAAMGFSPAEINTVFEVTSALLHASNLTFERIGEIECALVMDNPHLQYVVDLLGITKEGLNQALCYYEITIGGTGRKGGETHKRVLSMEQCEKGTEALIKATYGALFNYLVTRVNASIVGDTGKDASRARRGGSAKEASIGILDIFGFESFQSNSFEQLCINYCNEALQQQFNRFVLRNEQEEYDREGIPWSFIEFPENQDVLDLIDLKGTGILHLLHDQCRTPGASDKTFALAMYEKCSSHERFEADSRQVAEQLFAIHHYAGLVEYNVEGFVEKTRDELPKSGSDLLLSSSSDFVKDLAEILQPAPPPSSKGKRMMSPRSGAAHRPTVGVQFKDQLEALRRKIDDTAPHYIRCLKPNNLLIPDHFDAALIADQLRCAGVIEAVRVSRLGYPQRFSHNQFIARYRVLGKKLKKKSAKYNPAKALVHSIMQRVKDQSDVGIQVGKTKVFLRRQAYDMLERLRRERFSAAVIVIQKAARGYLCRKSFTKALRCLVTIQCLARKTLAKKQVGEMRQNHKSLIIQRSWRKHLAIKLLVSAQLIARWGQTHQRGSAGRRRYDELNRERKARYLQSQWRGCLAQKRYRRCIHAAWTIQCARRCYSARVTLARIRAEARNLNAVVEERDRLRQEVVALRNQLMEPKEENNAALKPDGAEGNETISNEKDIEIASLRKALDQVSKEKERVDCELKEVNKALMEQSSEMDAVVLDRDDLKQVNRAIQIELNSREEEVRDMKKEMSKLRKSIDGRESSASKVVSTDTSQVVELKDEIRHLKEMNATLQKDNDLLSTLPSTTRGIAATPINKTSGPVKDEPLPIEDKANDVVERKSLTIEEKSPNLVNPSVCTSFTVDMTETEEEMAKLREENQVLRKQLELLRVNNEFEYIPDDQEYDESVNPDSKGSIDSGYIGEANALSESVRQQICTEVEIVTEEVITKTRAESESKIAKLQSEIEELKTELERSNRLAKYDLDDVTRVNRSLREDLEAIAEEKTALEEELDTKCEEFDALSEDVERFADTFATQHEQLQQVESLTKKLQAENERLKAAEDGNVERIRELETLLESKKTEWVVSEIGKLRDEIGRIRETPHSVASAPRRRSQRSIENMSPPDSGNEES